MKRDHYLNWRSKVGFIVGISVFLAICFCSARPSLEQVSEKLMLPGALVCAAFGLGRDDLYGVLIYIFGNALLYGVAFAALFLIAIPRRRLARLPSTGGEEKD